MDNDFIRDIIKDVVSLLMEEELLECNEDTTKEDYMHAIEEMADEKIKKLGTKINRRASNNVENLLKKKMSQGFDIGIECKGKGREYEMTFEGTASSVNTPPGDRFFESVLYHGVGNTIEELLNNMFDKNTGKKTKKKDK